VLVPREHTSSTAPVIGAAFGRSDGSDELRARERALAGWLVVAVGLAYLITQLLVIAFSRPPGWDESIYLSQITPGIDAMVFDPWRARGITLLVAPITWLGGSVREVRLFLMVASAVAMMTTFRVWVPLVGLAAPAAAAMFSFSWLALVNGSEVMPNLWAAILGLATVGLIARRTEGGGIRHTVLASVTLCAMALIRPTEAAVLACAIGLWIVLFRRSSWRAIVALGAGLTIGWLPWFVEMSVRFGGPIQALREAATGHFATASVGDNLFIHLAATGGQLKGSHVPRGGVLWWVLLVALALVAMASAPRRAERTLAVLTCLGALALAVEYLGFVSTLTAPRFLLPAYALASMPMGIGLMALLRGRVLPPPADVVVAKIVGALVLILIVPWAVWQGIAADRYQDLRMQSTVAFSEVGLVVRDLAGGRPCAFMAPHGWPMIQFAAGCDGARLPRPRGPTKAEFEELESGDTQFFVIVKRVVPPTSPLASLTPTLIQGPRRTWLMYHIVPTAA
jgi:hypothetical protein